MTDQELKQLYYTEWIKYIEQKDQKIVIHETVDNDTKLFRDGFVLYHLYDDIYYEACISSSLHMNGTARVYLSSGVTLEKPYNLWQTPDGNACYTFPEVDAIVRNQWTELRHK